MTSGPDSSRRGLIAAMRRRDDAVPARILELHGRMLRGFLREALRDPEAAEDVLQQVLLEAWQRSPDYDPTRASLPTWLLTIARSRAIDQLRRRIPEPVDPSAIATVGDPVASDQITAVQDRWRVAGLLATLPRDEARMLALRFYRGLSQREIADLTGIPLGTVKTRMVQALERLRAELNEELR
jgi:RNA polymerase sigma-70 factor (ECF subfamily)